MKHPLPRLVAATLFASQCAVIAPTTLADPFADHVVYNWDGTTATYTPGGSDNQSFGPFHANSNLWGANALAAGAVLGEPNSLDRDDVDFLNPTFREISIVWPAWYQGTTDTAAANTNYNTNPTGATKKSNGIGLGGGGQFVVEFDEPITNDPLNPYGVDFIAHGNTFFASGVTVNANANMNTFAIGDFNGMGEGAVFAEPVFVSVAQSLDGPWYHFRQPNPDYPGDPFADPYLTAPGTDDFFPSQPLKWDRERVNPNTGQTGDWTSETNDWTKPVNPAWLDQNPFGGITAADAMDLYAGSAGGTPFNLDWLVDDSDNPVSLDWVKYVKFTDPYGYQGEVTGVVNAAPVALGDAMAVDPINITDGTATLIFTNDARDAVMATVDFLSLSDIAAVRVAPLQVGDLADYAPLPAAVLNATALYDLSVGMILGEDEIVFDADLSLAVGDAYLGDGSDLIALRWDAQAEAWQNLPISGYDAGSGLVSLAGVSDAAPFVVAVIPEPTTAIALALVGVAVCRRRRLPMPWPAMDQSRATRMIERTTRTRTTRTREFHHAAPTP